MLPLIILVLAALVRQPLRAAKSVEPVDHVALAQALTIWVKQQRAEHGLPELSISNALAKATQGHACDMV